MAAFPAMLAAVAVTVATLFVEEMLLLLLLLLPLPTTSAKKSTVSVCRVSDTVVSLHVFQATMGALVAVSGLVATLAMAGLMELMGS